MIERQLVYQLIAPAGLHFANGLAVEWKGDLTLAKVASNNKEIWTPKLVQFSALAALALGLPTDLLWRCVAKLPKLVLQIFSLTHSNVR